MCFFTILGLHFLLPFNKILEFKNSTLRNDFELAPVALVTGMGPIISPVLTMNCKLIVLETNVTIYSSYCNIAHLGMLVLPSDSSLPTTGLSPYFNNDRLIIQTLVIPREIVNLEVVLAVVVGDVESVEVMLAVVGDVESVEVVLAVVGD